MKRPSGGESRVQPGERDATWDGGPCVPFNKSRFKGSTMWPPHFLAINGVLAVQSDQTQVIAGTVGFTAWSSTGIKMSRRDSWPVGASMNYDRNRCRACLCAALKCSPSCVRPSAGLFSVISHPPTSWLPPPNDHVLKINLDKKNLKLLLCDVDRGDVRVKSLLLLLQQVNQSWSSRSTWRTDPWTASWGWVQTGN